MTSQMVRSRIFAVQLFAHSSQQRVYFCEKFLGWETAERGVPHPLMAHGANAALYLLRVGDAAQRRRDHVAMLERGNKLRALGRIMPKPVQQLRKTPFRRIHSAAPLNRFQVFAPR